MLVIELKHVSDMIFTNGYSISKVSHAIKMCYPLPPLPVHVNSILHLEPPCATPFFYICNDLIPPAPTLQIIYQSPSVLMELP